MARNRVLARGNELTLPVLAGVVSGSPVVVGMLVGVALTSRDGNGNAVIKTDGVWLVSVTGAVANVGAPIYINSATYALTVAPGIGVQLWGHALDTRARARAPSVSGSPTTQWPTANRPDRETVQRVAQFDRREEPHE